MRTAHYKLLPHRERSRHRVAANFPAVYAQALRRRRRRSFHSPLDIAGLKLWLDAAIGGSGVWAASPASGAPWIDYSSSAGYPANGHTHSIRVYAFRTVESERVYSARFLELQVTDDNSSQLYYVNWSWDAVAGAEGYRILKADTSSDYNFDFHFDVSGETSFVDSGAGMFSSGADVLPWDDGAIAADFAISQWNDQSGLNNHATALGASQSALWQPSVANGRPVLRFDSVTGYTTPLVLTPPCTLCAVYTLNGAGDLARRAVQGSNNWLIGPYGPLHDFYDGVFSGGPALVRGQFVAQAAWQDGSVSRNFVNGAFAGSALGAGDGPGTVALGAGGLIGEGLEGDLAEVIAYDSALSEINLANVWSYLAAKYELS